MKTSRAGYSLLFKHLGLSLLLVSSILIGVNAKLLSAEQPCTEEKMRPRLEVLRDKDLQKTDRSRVEIAIREIGRMRCVEAIDDLVTLLTFRSSYHEKAPFRLQPLYTGTRYPATGAIAEMGRVALPVLARLIETNDEDSLLSKNARFTVRSIIKEPPLEKEFFTSAAAKSSTPEGRRRLLKGVDTELADFRSD